MIIRYRETHLIRRIVGAVSILAAGLMLTTATPVGASPGSWVLQSSPNAPAPAQSLLYGDSCMSTTFCVAVGVAATAADAPLIEMWNGIDWSIAPITLGAEVLDSVSCTSNTFCMAVLRQSKELISGFTSSCRIA